MSMQSPRNLREWQQAVERKLAASKNGTRIAIEQGTKAADVVREEVDNYKNLTPAAPVEVVYSTSTYIDANKRRRGKAIADFPDVVFATNGTPIGIERYEVYGQDQGLNPLQNFQSMGVASQSSVVVSDLNPGSVWKFKVRAFGDGIIKAGLFSTEQTITIVADTTPPGQPSTPVVTANGGSITVQWDGLLAGGGAVPGDFAFIEVAFGTTSSPTTKVGEFYSKSLDVFPKTAYNTPHYVRFRAWDTSGNASAWSAQASAIPVPLVDADIILSAIDAAETVITNIGTASLVDGAILASKLADNAVTQAKILAGAVSLAKMDTIANDKITKGINDAAAAQSTATAANTAAGTAQTAADKAQAQVDAIAAQGANLIFNGDVDMAVVGTAATGWSTRQLTNCEVDARARSGTQLLKLSPTTSTISYYYSNHVATTVGRTFYFEMYARLSSAIVTNAAGGGALQFAINTTRLDGSTITNLVSGTGFALTDLTTTGWTRLYGQFTTTDANTKTIRLGPRGAGNGNVFLVDDVRMVDMTEAKAALDAAATAQAKADTAFNDAQTALTNAGLAQTAANAKNAVYYTASAPGGTGFKVNDIWFRSSDNRVHIWDGDSWEARADAAIATAQSAATAAGNAAATADGKAVTAQTAANNASSAAATAQTAANNAATAAATADGKAAAAQTAADNAASAAQAAQQAGEDAATLASAMVTISTSPAPATAAPDGGAIWQQIDANNTDRIIGQWVAGNDLVWRPRLLQDSVLGNISAVKITTGTMSAARVDAAEMRAAILLVGKITAADIVAGSLTSASGIFGTMNASVISAGTIDAARLNSADIRAKFLFAGLITASEIMAGTLTSASGVFGTLDANILNTGTLNAARLNAGDIRAKFLTAGLITAADMVTGTITAASGIIGSLDIGKVTTGTMSGSFITAKTLRAEHLMVTDLTAFAPSPAESPADWELTTGMEIVATALDASGMRFQSADNASTQIARGPYKSVRAGEKLYAFARVFRGAGATQSNYLRYYWYDKDKVLLTPSYTDVEAPSAVGNGGTLSGVVTVPTDAAYARYFLLTGTGTGNVGYYHLSGYKQNGSVLIEDGVINAAKINASSVAGAVGSFLTINVSQLNATAASMDSAVINKLWTDVVRSRKITTDMLVVAGENLIPDPYLMDTDQNAYRSSAVLNGPIVFATDDVSSAGTIKLNVHSTTLTTVYLHTTDTAIKVFPGESYQFVLNYRTRGTTVGGGATATVRFTLWHHGPSGNYIRNVDLPVRTMTGASGASWLTMTEAYTIPVDVGAIRVGLQMNNMASTGELEVKVPRLKRRLNADLIVDGSILTRHLTVTSDMTVALLAAHKVLASEIETNTLTADTGFVSSMRTNILTTDVVKAVNIDATGGITSRHTITGATIQTHAAANTGIKLEGGFFRAYNAGNTETFSISGATGAVTGTGTFQTGTSGNFIKMYANAQGGILHLFTGSGSGRGSVWARSGTDDRMSLTYSNFDEPGGTLPVVVLKDNEVYMNYGSRAFRVRNNAGTEELVIDAPGASTLVYGNMDMKDGRTQYRYGSQLHLGYVGQAPASGSSPDFEVRADSGNIRLATNNAITALTVYNTTTGSAANVFIDSSGKLWRSSSAERYKVDIKPYKVESTLFDVDVVEWTDKGQLEARKRIDSLPRPLNRTDTEEENAIDLRRLSGVIAERLEEKGLERYVTYGDQGQTEGVAYERFNLARTEFLYEKLMEAFEQIEELRARLDA